MVTFFFFRRYIADLPDTESRKRKHDQIRFENYLQHASSQIQSYVTIDETGITKTIYGTAQPNATRL